MKISIITPVFNSSDTIADCIQSVFSQSHEDIEHIIIDGASTDDSLDKIHSLPNRVKVLVSEPDSGIYDALNKGIKLATGEIIGILHSDDLLPDNDTIKGVIQAFSNSMDANGKSPDGIYGNLNYVSKLDLNHVIRNWESCPFRTKLLKQGWMPPHPTLFLRKAVYEKHGRFDLTYSIAADYDFILRIFSDPELTFHYHPYLLCKMRVGGISNGSIKSILRKSNEDLRALRSNKISWPYWVLLQKNVSKLSQFLPK